MNKIAILGDTHFGVRGDSLDFHRYYEKFFSEIFFPYLLENDIKLVIQLGDINDRRKMVNVYSVYLSKKYFFDKLKEYDIKMVTLLGNHDIFFKNTVEVNSPEIILSGYDNVQIVKSFTTLDIDGIPVDIIPWICEENEEHITNSIKQSRSSICFGHFEIGGFEVHRGVVFKGNFDSSILKKYDMVMSGHFHHKSNDGHVYFLGTPGENTWSDWNDPRGFHIFDVQTRSLEFIENPNKMFHKIIYDDTENDVEYYQKFDFESYKDTYVKVVVMSKKNIFLFDTFIDNLLKSGVADVGIVEDFDVEEKAVEDIDQAEDTITILEKCIDITDLDIDSNRLKQVMRQIYLEAVNLQKSE